jgi:hypothetical protein
MGRDALRGALVAVAAFAAADARAAGEAAVPARVDVDALVALLAAGPDDPAADGPSPTARVARLVAAGDAKLRPVLADAWRIAATVPAAANRRDAVRRLVRFLYDLGLPDAPGAWLVEADGAVRVRRVAADGAEPQDRMSARETADVPIPFEEAVKGGRLRAVPRPDAKRLLSLLDAGGVPTEERDALAQALGEQCVATTALVRELVRRVQAERAEPWTSIALAWTGRPEAEAPLRERIRRIASVSWGGGTTVPLAWACRGLAHVSPAALDEEIGAIKGSVRETALAVAGIDAATRVDVAAIASAGDAAARERIVAGACRRIVAAHGEPRASSATLSSLAPLLAEHGDDGDALARAVLADAARRLFWPANVAARPAAGGDDLGPYPSTGVRLAAITEDMKAGALAFADAGVSLFDLAAAPRRGEARPLRSSVGGLQAGGSADGGEPFRLTGEVIGRFLRLTLRNESQELRLVDRIALRHGVATLVSGDAYAGPVAGRGMRRLELTLGVLRAATTPADRLVPVLPGETFSWSVELREEDRDVDQVTVALADLVAPRGQPAAQRLERFAATRVK